jgi:hypothetical protein
MYAALTLDAVSSAGSTILVDARDLVCPWAAGLEILEEYASREFEYHDWDLRSNGFIDECGRIAINGGSFEFE